MNFIPYIYITQPSVYLDAEKKKRQKILLEKQLLGKMLCHTYKFLNLSLCLKRSVGVEKTLNKTDSGTYNYVGHMQPKENRKTSK